MKKKTFLTQFLKEPDRENLLDTSLGPQQVQRRPREMPERSSRGRFRCKRHSVKLDKAQSRRNVTLYRIIVPSSPPPYSWNTLNSNELSLHLFLSHQHHCIIQKLTSGEYAINNAEPGTRIIIEFAGPRSTE